MCLSIPGKVLSVSENTAKVDVGGTVTCAKLDLLEDIRVGDYVLVHTGFAIQKYDQKDALETLAAFKEILINGKLQ